VNILNSSTEKSSDDSPDVDSVIPEGTKYLEFTPTERPHDAESQHFGVDSKNRRFQTMTRPADAGLFEKDLWFGTFPIGATEREKKEIQEEIDRLTRKRNDYLTHPAGHNIRSECQEGIDALREELKKCSV
jgi:hypothetical protein